MPESTCPPSLQRPRRRTAWRAFAVLVLSFALAACGGPPGGGGGPGDGDFGAGEVAQSAGASRYAAEGAFEGRVDLTIAETSDPSGSVALPDGLAIAILEDDVAYAPPPEDGPLPDPLPGR